MTAKKPRTDWKKKALEAEASSLYWKANATVWRNKYRTLEDGLVNNQAKEIVNHDRG